MNPQEAAFIADIREHPDDDMPRLIFSDWLQENGQEKRAAFIRIQCELARLPPVSARSPGIGHLEKLSRFEKLSLVSREFIIKYGIDLLAGFEVPGAMLYAPPLFRRGFVEVLMGPAEVWIATGDTICAATPLREVQLTTMLDIVPVNGRNPEGKRVASWPGYDGNENWVELDPEKHYAKDEVVDWLLKRRWPGVKFKLPMQRTYQIPDNDIERVTGEPDNRPEQTESVSTIYWPTFFF